MRALRATSRYRVRIHRHSWIAKSCFGISAISLAACDQTAGTSTSTTAATTTTTVPATTTTTLTANEKAIVAAIAKLPVNATHPNFVLAKTGAVNSGAGCPSTDALDQSAVLTINGAVDLENMIYSDLAGRNTTFVNYFDRAILETPQDGFAQLFASNFGSSSQGTLSSANISVERLSADSSLASSISAACGPTVTNASWRIIFCSVGIAVAACDPGITTTELAINRNGTWLIWYVGSGLQ